MGGSTKAKAFMGIAVGLSCLAGASYAEDDSGKVDRSDPTAANTRLERAYNDAIRRLPDPKAMDDPWGSVRAVDVTGKPKSKDKQTSGVK